MSLKISKSLSLPLDSVTKTFAILAQRRKGKTYTANVMAEEMVAAKQPWVALDPTSAWWGLRSSADGSKAGLPVVIIGGEHGDVPLERGAGQVIADLVVDEPGWYVLDLGHLDSKNAEREFVTAFAERFYRRKGKSPDPVHLFVDEADMFVPQRSPSGDQRMLGAFEAIVRRGGIRGIGTTLISQRAAVVNKNVLEQIDVLITLRVVGPNDQKAIETYVKAQGSDEERAELMASLASLKLGEAWIWEPGAEPPLFERVQIRKRRTFNSSATPKSGERKTEPRKLADVDLEQLRGKIADTIERAKAEDPKELRKENARLSNELRRAEKKADELAETAAAKIEVEKIVEVPVLANGHVKALENFLEGMGRVVGQFEQVRDSIVSELQRVQTSQSSRAPQRASRAAQREAATPAAAVGGGRREAPRRPPAQPPEDVGEIKLKAGARRMLTALAQLHPTPLTRVQVATLADVSPKSGTFSDYVSAIKRAGLAFEERGEISLTEAGVEEMSEQLGAGAPSVEELHAMWARKFKAGARRMLEVLVEEYPNGVTRDELAEAAEIARSSGTFSDYLSALKRNTVAEERAGEIFAGAALFIGAPA